MKIKTRSLVFIVLMGIAGNVLGFYSIPLPIPLVNVAFTLSQLPALFTAIYVGPLEGGIVGFLSTIASTVLFIKNPFVPFGNFILAFAAGYFYKHKFVGKRISAIPSCILGEVVETPFVWLTVIVWSGLILGVQISILVPIIAFINFKAFLEVAIDAILLEIVLPYLEKFLGEVREELTLIQ
jgi:riboflavin transporter FmnP